MQKSIPRRCQGGIKSGKLDESEGKEKGKERKARKESPAGRINPKRSGGRCPGHERDQLTHVTRQVAPSCAIN